MNRAATSKEEILNICRQMVMNEGISSVNMRNVAKACQVAVGCLYNYFPSKADLLRETVESVWTDIFHMDNMPKFCGFTECLLWLYENIHSGGNKYPGFFNVHSINFAAQDKEEGRRMMEHYFGHMKKQLLCELQKDSAVREGIFGGGLTKEKFIDFIFTLLMSELLKENGDGKALGEFVKHYIY